MKIGILTYHCVPNFGAQLQAMSTVGYLCRMGHEAVVLHWYPQNLEDMYRNGRIPSAQMDCHEEFTKEQLPITRLCRTEAELIRVVDEEKLDGIVLGSDALFKFRPVATRKEGEIVPSEMLEENPFFGEFLGKISKHIPASVYAVSSQDCAFKHMTTEEKSRMKNAMSNFSFISVRDEWTADMVRYVTGKKDVPIYPDPVFGFNANMGDKVLTKEDVCKRFNLPEKYVLISFSQHFMQSEYIQKLAACFLEKGLEPVVLTMPEGLQDFGLKSTIDVPVTPLEWYSLIIHSSGFIGERMHPIVVCLHNAVPFFCFDEYGCLKPKYFTRKKFWIPRYVPDWHTSKTYLILRRADLLKNWFSYHSGENYPSVDNVVESLFTFEKGKCKTFAKSYQEKYEEGMKEIIEHLK